MKKTKSPSSRVAVASGPAGILCGTDFSRAADGAVDVATDFAHRLGAPLTLAHALELPHALKGDAKATRWLTAIRKRWLRERADASRARGVMVAESVTLGRADEVLVTKAAADEARFIVVSSLGDRRPDKWLLGSVAERTSQRAAVPTLVVRHGEPLRAWLRGTKPLKVFVGFNFSASAEAALRWTKELLALGPCEVVLGYVNHPIDDYVRLGTKGRLPFDGNPPEIVDLLERDLRERARVLLGPTSVRCRVEDQLGANDEQLLRMAREEGADLIVVGSRQSAGLQRLWNVSVSRGLLSNAETSVAIVPVATTRRPARTAPTRHVLVSTDLTPIGNSALPHAYSLVRGRGVVTLLHVLPPPPRAVLASGRSGSAQHRNRPPFDDQRVAEFTARLRALIPPESARLGITTRVEVISHGQVGLAIAQAAERLGVDVVCVASRGQSGLTKLLFGSVAEEVVARVRRPVFIVRPLPC